MLDYERDANQWTFKTSSNTAQTHEIYIWKNTATAVYFRFRILRTSGGDKTVYVKWSKTSNNDLMRSVQEDQCAQDTYTATSNSSSVTLKKDDTTFIYNDANSQYKNFRTYQFLSSQTAFFGLLSYSIKKQIYDNDDKPGTSTTEAFTIATATAVAQPSTDYTDNTYYPSRIYCLVNSADASAPKTYRRYTSVFTDVINAVTGVTNMSCDSSSDAPTVTVGVANPETFTPATELIAPF